MNLRWISFLISRTKQHQIALVGQVFLRRFGFNLFLCWRGFSPFEMQMSHKNKARNPKRFVGCQVTNTQHHWKCMDLFSSLCQKNHVRISKTLFSCWDMTSQIGFESSSHIRSILVFVPAISCNIFSMNGMYHTNGLHNTLVIPCYPSSSAMLSYPCSPSYCPCH